MDARQLRRLSTLTAGAAAVVALSFGTLVLAVTGSDIIVHETAGLLLLLLVPTSLLAASRSRPASRGPVRWRLLALIDLLVLLAFGGLLAAGLLPMDLSVLPLLALGVLVVLLGAALYSDRTSAGRPDRSAPARAE